jgi:hypothetical protein
MAIRKKRSVARKVCESAPKVLLLPIVLLILFPILVLALAMHFLNLILVYVLIGLWWIPNGKDILYVSSDSPIWRDYMETQILPLLAKRAMVLNWSEREKWSWLSFPVRVFRAFKGGRDFNPMVVVFRPSRRARVFRFLPAFKEWKWGRKEKLEQLRRDLMLAL